MESDKIKDTINLAIGRIHKIHKAAENALKGRRVKIISDYNGQPFGSSRPSLRGKEFIIKAVDITDTRCSIWDGNFDHCFIDIEEVEFI